MLKLLEFSDINNTERGNNLFVEKETGSIAFFSKVDEVNFLQFTYTPDNYPAVDMRIVEISEKRLCMHINENLLGWSANKCQLEGVILDENCTVVGTDND